MNTFQLDLQLLPNPSLQLGPFFALREPLCLPDLAIRHILAMRFRSSARSMHERARPNLSRTAENLLEGADKKSLRVEFAMEFRVAETGKLDQRADGGGTKYLDLPRSCAVHNDLAGVEGRQEGNLLYHENLHQLRDVVAIRHVGLLFVGEDCEELASRGFALFELRNFIQL